MPSWAYQVATVEEHHNAVIINAHNAEVIILFLTMTLRFTDICAGCNLQQHAASHLHDFGSDLKMYPVRATQWQSAGRSISKYAGASIKLCKDVLA